MKLFLILLCIGLSVTLVIGIGLLIKTKMYRPPDRHDLANTLDTEIKKFLKRSGEHAVVVGVYKDGRLFSKGYGVTAKDTGQVPDARTVFQIGSITKVFTASLLQALSDKNVVDLDSTLGELIGDSVPMTDRVMNISLKQLATHTSGLPRIPKQMLRRIEEVAGKDNVLEDPYSYLCPADMFTYLETAPDTKASGKFAYSNYGVGMLAHVLENVTGESYEDMLQQEVLTSLNMPSTGVTLIPEIEQRFAQGYDAKGKPARIWHSKSLGGAGALYSTMDDMLQFVKASLDIGTPTNTLFEKMRVPQRSGHTGLGWMLPGFIDKLHGNHTTVWHNGMTGGYSSYMSIDPALRSGVVLLSSRALDVTVMGVLLSRHVRTQSWADQISRTAK